MRIAVLAFDTRGGVQPYVALSLGLRAVGHDVTMITTAGFADLVTGHGVQHVATTGDTEAAVRAAGGAAELNSRDRNRLMREQLHATLGQTSVEILAAAADADLLLGGVGGSVTGRPVAEKLGVPWVDAHLQPLGPPTAAFPGALFPQVPLWMGGVGRRGSHVITNTALSSMFRGAQRQVRTRLDLPRHPETPRKDLPTLYGFSAQVVPQPLDWGPHRKITGYWTLAADPGWVPPPDLVDFIATGPPPVCIGFGSMSSRDPEALTDLVLEAVHLAGVRAVLLSGWGGLAERGGAEVFVAGDVPHDWLYPQLAAVVHHGGAGTTGAALRSGVPAIVVPFAVDQPFWGSRVAALGVGPRSLPRRQLTAQKLGHALRAAVADDPMHRRATDLGLRLQAEDGVGTAVQHLAGYVL